MSVVRSTGWTWSRFVSWAFGPRRLAHLAILTDEAKRRADFLVSVPEAGDVRERLRAQLREAATSCEVLLLFPEADLAGALATAAVSPGVPESERARLAAGCAVLERMVGGRLATLARLPLAAHGAGELAA